MSDFVIEPPQIPAVPVTGKGAFPVRRVFCVGRNYAAHAREMGADPDREPPFFFTKPADALVTRPVVAFPPATKSLHHEVELVIAIGRGGAAIPASSALDHVYGYAAGIDLTRRDMQDEAKFLRRPWDMSKGFDESAPIGPIVPAAQVGHPTTGHISLTINGKPRQDGDLADMIWPVPDIVAFLSNLVTLQPGDLIFTGTPEGVGVVERGDTLAAEIEGVGGFTFKVE